MRNYLADTPGGEHHPPSRADPTFTGRNRSGRGAAAGRSCARLCGVSQAQPASAGTGYGVDVAAECFIAAAPALVRDRLAGPGFTGALWPDLTVTVARDRGAEGWRYTVSGPLTGTAEVWLEACADGVIVHVYLRTAAADAARPARRAAAERDRRHRHATEVLWSVKDALEDGRQPGEPAVAAGPDAVPEPAEPAVGRGATTAPRHGVASRP